MKRPDDLTPSALPIGIDDWGRGFPGGGSDLNVIVAVKL